MMLESSRAIKCPSLRYHLAGMKCFQLALMKTNFLENIFQDHEQHLNDFQEITEEMFTINQIIDDSSLQQRIDNNPEAFYLKQSREGGIISLTKPFPSIIDFFFSRWKCLLWFSIEVKQR